MRWIFNSVTIAQKRFEEGLNMGAMMKFGAVCCLLLICGAGSENAIASGGIALFADPLRMWDYSGAVYANKVDGADTFSCEVDYAVFDLDAIVYNGFDPSAGQDKYLYAYQVFNIGSSSVDLTRFAVDIPQGTTIDHIAYDWTKGRLDGVPSSIQEFVGGAAVWQFGTSPGTYTVAPEAHSLVLVFTSNQQPDKGAAKLFYSEDTGDYMSVPVASPLVVPEPAAIALLSFGAAAVLRKRSVRKV
jgi:hypothetical protein